MKNPTDNPFYSGTYDGHHCYAQSVDDRRDMIRRFTTEECHQALRLADLQRSVVIAIDRRLKQLEKDHATRN